MDENTEGSFEIQESLVLSKQERINEKRVGLLRAMSAGRLDTIQERVALILNYHPETRDSDISLQLKYWETFEPELLSDDFVCKSNLYRLTRLSSLTRARAKIQNTYKLFQASPEVRKQRGMLAENEFAKARQQKATRGRFAVYVDESGKTGKFLLVGSLWFLHLPQFLSFLSEFSEFKREVGYKDREFHFKELTPKNLDAHMRLADWLAARLSVVSFKAVSVERAGLNVPKALETMFYHLIMRGVDHEHMSGRAPLPRGIEIWKDLEEAGSDKLFLAELGDRLRIASEARLGGDLQIGELEAVDSKDNPLLQIADLYVGSLNRTLNSDSEKEGPKDKFAAHFLDLLGLPRGPQQREVVGDLAIHVSL